MTHLTSEPLKRSIGRLREDIHRLLDRWMKRRSASGNGKLSNLGDGPPIEFEDRPDEVVVEAEIPGFDNKDVHIEVMDNRLILRGRKNIEDEERGPNYYRIARDMREFVRVIPLPPGVDAERASAKYKNGMLRVVLPKTENARAKRIEVRAS
jgi:HSP20 family protein